MMGRRKESEVVPVLDLELRCFRRVARTYQAFSSKAEKRSLRNVYRCSVLSPPVHIPFWKHVIQTGGVPY
jgi:hypothetical protein